MTDPGRKGLAFPSSWGVFEGKPLPSPTLRALYPAIVPGAASLAILAMLTSGGSSSLLILLVPLAIVVLAEAGRFASNVERGIEDLVLLQLPAILGPGLFLGACHWINGRSLEGVPTAALVLAAAAGLALLVFGWGPVRLSKSLLHAHPVLTSSPPAKDFDLPLLLPAFFYAVILGTAAWLQTSTGGLGTVTPFVLVGLLLVVAPISILSRGARVLALYLHAPSSMEAAYPPGVWAPSTPRRARILAWNTQAMLVSLACAALAPTMVGDAALAAFLAEPSEALPLLTLEHLVAVAAYAILLPPVLLLGSYAPVLFALERLKRRINQAARSDPSTLWEHVIERLRTSPRETRDRNGHVVRERDHLLVGFHQHASAPVLLHRKILEEHAYICGRTGSGKTSRALMPLLIQLVRGRGEDDDPPPILVLDLKGDPALFHTAREEAARPRADGSVWQEFRYFTLDSAHPGDGFNPLKTFCSRPRNSLELANQLLEALSLDYGDQYGRSFYSGGSREILEAALRDTGSNESFAALYERVQADKASKKYEIRSKLHALAGYRQLHPTDGEPALNMHEVLERRQLVYFYLDSGSGAVGAREVARLALFALLDAALLRQKDGKPPRRAYVIIDEFQVIATVNIQQVVQQARSRGISLILANQSIQDLRVEGTNLLSTVRTNTRYKQFFSVEDADAMREMIDMSGEQVEYLRSYGTSQSDGRFGPSSGSSETDRPMYRPRLEANVIIGVSEAEGGALVHLSSSYGMSDFGGNFVPILSPHCLPAEVYDERTHSTLPSKLPEPTEVMSPTRTAGPEMSTSPADRGVQSPAASEDAGLSELKAERALRLRSLAAELQEAERVDS